MLTLWRPRAADLARGSGLGIRLGLMQVSNPGLHQSWWAPQGFIVVSLVRGWAVSGLMPVTLTGWYCGWFHARR
jgi:hypothetical protein